MKESQSNLAYLFTWNNKLINKFSDILNDTNNQSSEKHTWYSLVILKLDLN